MDLQSNKLEEVDILTCVPGSGPRHMVVAPERIKGGGPILYVIFEMGSFVSSYNIQPDGRLVLRQSISTLPTPTTAPTKAAELLLSSDHLHLFATNRGFDTPSTNSVAIFALNGDGGLNVLQDLTPIICVLKPFDWFLF